MGRVDEESLSLISPQGTAKTVGKPLEKQKSLTRMLSSRSRKRSRSRPPSPPLDEPQAPSPKVPVQFLPPSLRLSSDLPRTPPTSVQESNRRKQAFQVYNGNVVNGLGGEQSTTDKGRQEVRTPSLKAMVGYQAAYELHPPGALNLEGTARPQTANTIRIHQVERPTMHHSPTFPLLYKRSRGDLKAPPVSPPIGRNRGLSTSSHKPRSSSLKAKDPNRPSTAAGHYAADHDRSEPYHKRGNDGYNTTHESRITGGDFPPNFYRPWQGLYENDEVRSSFRSALTTGSSYMDTTNTERSSVVTKDTSIYESVVESSESPVSKPMGMTVDDAIDMYVAGFADDFESDHDNPAPSTISEEERRRSIRIAEAINDNIDSELLPPARPPTSGSRSSTAIMSGAVFRIISPKPPSILPPTQTRDQYGFLKASHHISIAQYNAWNTKYISGQARRTKKWSSFMKEQGLPTYLPSRFPDRSVKAQRYVRKGIPPAWRGAAWFHYAGGHVLLNTQPTLYNTLLSQSDDLNDNDKESIERDLHRTFPDNVHFKPDCSSTTPTPHPSPEPPLLASLRRVLQAFALHSPRVGYCQSLNFLTGLLLLFLPEEKAFWMLHIITTDFLPGTHEISLEGANVDLWVLMIALKESIPGIWAKIGVGGEEDTGVHGARLPPISLCTTSWFMSLFIGTLPIESVLRVWDVLFYEGSKALFRVALAIFKIGEQRIKDVSDSMEIFQVVQALPRGMLDVGMLTKVAWRRGGVSHEWVEKKRKERRKWYARERAEKGIQSPGSGGRRSRDDATPMLVRANSTWRRKVRLGREAT